MVRCFPNFFNLISSNIHHCYQYCTATGIYHSYKYLRHSCPSVIYSFSIKQKQYQKSLNDLHTLHPISYHVSWRPIRTFSDIRSVPPNSPRFYPGLKRICSFSETYQVSHPSHFPALYIFSVLPTLIHGSSGFTITTIGVPHPTVISPRNSATYDTNFSHRTP